MKIYRHFGYNADWYELDVDLKFNIKSSLLKDLRDKFLKECEHAFNQAVAEMVTTQYQESGNETFI